MAWRTTRSGRTNRSFRPSALEEGSTKLEARQLLSTLPDGFTESVVASGFVYPGSMAIAPDGRIFVSEMAGTIQVIKDGRVLPEPLATLNVEHTVSQGLMGLAFDPQFPAKPYVYVYYVTADDGLRNRVSRLTVDGDIAVAGSERVLFQSEKFNIAPGEPAHDGGAIAFGPDGKLYLSTGDMLDANHSQQLTNTFGKVLRINPDGTIPKDNPFFRRTRGVARAIWAYGLRNPYTITFQPGTDRLYVNDVGAAAFEEINLGVKGANYGWPKTEGPTKRRGVHSPIYSYDHRQGATHVDAAIIGGAFYNPSQASFPNEYLGQYFFSDYAQGFIRRLDPQTRVVSTFATGLPHGIVDVDLDAQGRLYYLTIDDGAVHVIQFANEAPPTLSGPLRDTLVPKNVDASLTVSPQGSYPFTFQWYADDQEVEGETSATLTIPASKIDENVAYRVRISNEFGAVLSNEAYASSTNDAAPTAKILSPLASARFRIGDVVSFVGQGLDDEAAGGVLPLSALRWQLDLLHNGHVHPNTYVVSGVSSGSFKIPRHDDPGQFALRLTLTVIDAAGQKASDSVIIQPGLASAARRRK
jgi:glucose/arabinose dehydrogenase